MELLLFDLVIHQYFTDARHYGTLIRQLTQPPGFPGRRIGLLLEARRMVVEIVGDSGALTDIRRRRAGTGSRDLVSPTRLSVRPDANGR
jgi:hypothetical protein